MSSPTMARRAPPRRDSASLRRGRRRCRTQRRNRRHRLAGGTITVLSAGDVDHIDPGQAYYSFRYEIAYATQRPLLAYKPKGSSNPRPRGRDADVLERRQDGNGAYPARRPVQPARQPRSDLGGREVRDRARVRDERRQRVRRRVLRRHRRRAGERDEWRAEHPRDRDTEQDTLVFRLTRRTAFHRIARVLMTAPVPRE